MRVLSVAAVPVRFGGSRGRPHVGTLAHVDPDLAHLAGARHRNIAGVRDDEARAPEGIGDPGTAQLVEKHAGLDVADKDLLAHAWPLKPSGHDNDPPARQAMLPMARTRGNARHADMPRPIHAPGRKGGSVQMARFATAAMAAGAAVSAARAAARLADLQ